MILGDFNAKVGGGPQNEVMGKFGLGVRNDRGDRLLTFCQENKMVLANTFFKLPKRRLYTWTSPRDRPGAIMRNQIDYITINHRFRNSVKSAKTYPGAFIGSDHNILVAEVCIRLKKLIQPKLPDRIDVNKLKDASTRIKVVHDLNEKLDNVTVNKDNQGIEAAWQNIKTAILEPCKKHLKRMKHKKEKDWMTEDILNLMETHQRLKASNVGKVEMRKIQNRIRYECRQAKEQWLRQKCVEMEHLQALHDTHNIHKKISELTGRRDQRTHYLLNDVGKIVIDTDEQLKLWEEYIERLFADEREEMANIEETTGPDILKEEVVYAIHNIKKGKAAGPDELPGDVLQLLDERHVAKLTDLFNMIYKSGKLPEDWLKSTLSHFPKNIMQRNVKNTAQSAL
ncbi:uncharacterized protein LOC120351667 [Nilaparvata lugens]|uniref:uncharacterized protein LOC120351667 n=1 Tax=Nilaparvata lugens TaxID=108931 RepID=UPI00193E350B|nr:uncharacterized protein LOC120351667 [Nilaparvata lugens]